VKRFYKSFLLLTFLCNFGLGSGFSGEFLKIRDMNNRKMEFVKIVTPLIEQANDNVLKERKTVELFFQKVESKGLNSVGKNEKLIIEKIAKRYKISSIKDKKAFEKKVAPVPTSLAIAQAAIESGWGTSRFAKDANNIFGQWIWTDDDRLGLVPKERENGKKHRVRIFVTLQSSVNSYILNLNSHSAYKDFRDLRYEKKGKYNGLEASDTMLRYSEIGENYVQLLKNIIKTNNFLKLDKTYKYEL
jgi:Bax protein